MTRMLLLAALATVTTLGQGRPAFEAAVIKPAAPLDNANLTFALKGEGMAKAQENSICFQHCYRENRLGEDLASFLSLRSLACCC